MSTFVSVGNARQPFNRLIEAVSGLAPELPKPVIIQHGHTPIVPGAYECVSFVDMEKFAEYIESSELLILHAGAGSVLQALQAGKKPVVVPRRSEYGEHVNNHQVEFAVMLARSGRINLVENVESLDRVVGEMGISKKVGISTSTWHSRLEPLMLTLVREALSQRSERLSGGSMT